MFIVIIDLAKCKIISCRRMGPREKRNDIDLDHYAQEFAKQNRLRINWHRCPIKDKMQPGHICIQFRSRRNAPIWLCRGRTYIFEGYDVMPWNTPHVVAQVEHTLEQKAKTSPMRYSDPSAR